MSFHLRAFGLTEIRDEAQGYWKWGPGRFCEAAAQGAAPWCKATGSEPTTQRRMSVWPDILPEKSNCELEALTK